MIPLKEAFEIVDRVVQCGNFLTETIETRKALGRVIAKDQFSLLDLPPFNKSAMDGYAVLENDDSAVFQLLEVVPAGGVPTKTLSSGTTIKVMTGASVPEETAKVVPVEYAVEKNYTVQFQSFSQASNICQKGEDVKCGDLILKAKTKLSALEIANLIACGITQVEVMRRPKIAIISTGDELVDSVENISAGKIMNSNGPMLETLCYQQGFEVTANISVEDNRARTIEVLKESLSLADIVLFSGGVSAGDFDFVSDALKEIELKTHFSRVAVKPGKPISFASKPNKYVFGLPGNPVSVYLMFHLFVQRAVDLMLEKKTQIKTAFLPLTKSFERKRTDRIEYVPCEFQKDGTLLPISYHGSAHLLALLKSDGFFIVPNDTKMFNAGDSVEFISF